MIFPILTITCAGAVGSEVITAIRQERWVDIVVGNAEEGEGFDFAWRYQGSIGGTGGEVTPGLVRIDGVGYTVDPIATAAWTLAGINTSVHYWVEIDTSSVTPTVTWKSGAAIPAGSETLIVYPILDFTCAGGVITSYIQRRCADIIYQRPACKESIEIDGGELHLVGDEAAPGNDQVYGTGATGTKGWKDDISVIWDGDAATPILYYIKSGVNITIDTPVNHATL
jgi:hypothetical protein